MSLFPPAAAVVVVLNGQRIASYGATFLTGGHVYAPLRPFVTRLADRIWFEKDRLVIVRDGRRIDVRTPSREPDALDHLYVPLAYVLRALGAAVTYHRGVLNVRFASTEVLATPTPFAGAQISPRPVFTPQPVPTPRPIWTGEPLPRRTPLPYPTPAMRA